VSGRRHRSQSTPRCWDGDRRWGWERSGTHVGAEQPGGGEVGCDTRGPDGRAAVRSGGQLGGGEVRRTMGDEVLARSGRLSEQVCGHEALSGQVLSGLSKPLTFVGPSHPTEVNITSISQPIGRQKLCYLPSAGSSRRKLLNLCWLHL
jgi:hypothetical protein